MLRILQTYDEARDLANAVQNLSLLKAFRVGITGKFLTVEIKKNTAVDLVLKLKEGEDKSLIGSYDVIKAIKEATCDVYNNKVRIIWLDLLERDDELLTEFAIEQGLEANPNSAYVDIVANVRWEDKDKEDDENPITSSIMTWDEDEDGEFDESKEVQE